MIPVECGGGPVRTLLVGLSTILVSDIRDELPEPGFGVEVLAVVSRVWGVLEVCVRGLRTEAMGMDRDKSLDMSHSGEGTQEAYRSTSRNISQARQRGETGGYTEEDRRRQERADDT